MTAALALLTDAELARMTDRAYWSAARAYQEARSAQYDHATSVILTLVAQSEQDYWRTLRAEQDRRKAAR